MIKFYGYKKCSSCRNAEKALEKLKIKYQFVDIIENPPSASALKNIVKQSNVELKKLFNTSGVQYRELKLKDKLPTLSKAEIFKLLAGNGRLIKRPIITDGKQSTIGYKEPELKQIWNA